MSDGIRVVIVDDHSIFRSGLRADLDASVDVVGEAADVPSAIAVIRDTMPDVVLLDVHLPGGPSIPTPPSERRSASPGASGARGPGSGTQNAEATGGEAVIRGSQPTASRFLALSVSDAAEDVVRVIRAGARGYITKGSSGAEVSRAVHAVAGGDAVFSPRLAGFVLDAFGAVSGETATAQDELDRLSAREQEVMRLIARGYAYKEVAAELFISIKTVETHVSAVLRKLQLSSRHELTVWASERRLL
ncbi:Oxygen regulatory protein NreC [Microbacterium hydrocarbonoxydans]|uniref:Oxygen regulatory protein NreC n=1 Tax=Microbacterium hydrocarbonoxydans TaxID=273678 RepID=A0A0M2HVS7_9MICO|nr:response regulator transcription factor [Microbacterium hydrocarbonoxydans]KJL49020.1 Oxygen regulatory protein NreC [Microbacterium hydrocarbonoxydans]